MKKIYLSLFLLSMISPFLYAQNGKHCFTDEVYHETLRNHPEIEAAEHQLEQFTQEFARNRRQSAHATSTIYVIPVVFHIIHEYGAENISDAQVRDAIRVLNRDYNLQNADTSLIISDFIGLKANVGIEFRLATIDPNGNCTNGIDRIVSFRTEIGDDPAKLNPWPNNKYLNIWTVKKFGPAHASAAAYAYRPGTAPSSAVDGVIALADYVGSIGTSNTTNERTLTHEIGHCLNLSHPWGNTNQPGVACGDDNVGDTPITKGWDHCPTSGYDVCNVGINENFQNYMDYSYCTRMFTIDQQTRMLAALNSSTAGRNNLWTPSNLTLTGTDGNINPPCAPVADFYPTAAHYCINDSVQYINNSFNADTINYTWSFPSGNPSTSTLKNPRVAYSAPGIYQATLTSYNAQGTDSITKDTVVTVHGPAVLTPIYTNDFETAGTFPDGDGYVINNYGNTWQRVTNVGYSSTSCMKMQNYSGQVGLTDSWVSPAIDFTGYNNTTLTFRLAYAQQLSSTRSDMLNVYTSVNCGKSWVLRRGLAGSVLASTAAVVGAFVPASAANWSLISVSPLSTLNNKSNVRLKFEFVSDGDNNIYIDDINFSASPVGIVEASKEALNFEVYPNPSNDMFNIAFDMPSFNHAEIKITDMLGREIKTVVNGRLDAGVHEYTLNTRDIGRGIYLVSLKAGELSTVKKLIVE